MNGLQELNGIKGQLVQSPPLCWTLETKNGFSLVFKTRLIEVHCDGLKVKAMTGFAPFYNYITQFKQ